MVQWLRGRCCQARIQVQSRSGKIPYAMLQLSLYTQLLSLGSARKAPGRKLSTTARKACAGKSPAQPQIHSFTKTERCKSGTHVYVTGVSGWDMNMEEDAVQGDLFVQRWVIILRRREFIPETLDVTARNGEGQCWRPA